MEALLKHGFTELCTKVERLFIRLPTEHISMNKANISLYVVLIVFGSLTPSAQDESH